MVKERFFSDSILFGSFLVAMSMVAVEVSWITSLFAGSILFWRWAAEKWSWPLLNKTITGVLSVLVLVQVLVEFRTLIGQEPSYTFLLGLSALRVMEYQGSRDRKFIILLGFILLAVKALFTIDIYWVLPTALSFLGFWISLLPKDYANKKSYLIKTFIKALPIAIVMFVVFPRVVIPWAMNRGSAQGEIGFSEELNPGAVASLASTDKVAFRVRFLRKAPFIRELYWRGAVLNRSLGLSWRPARQLFLPQNPEILYDDPFYEVALEATAKHFLFTLEPTAFVKAPDLRIVKSDAEEFRTTRPMQKATVYQGAFEENFNRKKKVSAEYNSETHLQTPPLTGETRQWVEEQKKKALKPQEYLQLLETFFSDKRFAYTLTPGTYEENDLNAFLFQRRRGFCEHFAGGYATLARALGIPARVVVGYHGGLFNQWGEFWRVSQKDAHAWVEVYHENSWMRVDPTSWVAPLRLRIGAEDFFALSEAQQKALARSPDWKPSSDRSSFSFDNMSFWLESLNYRWIYLLIEFDIEAQGSLLRSLADMKGSLFLALLVISAGYLFLVRKRFYKKPLSSNERLIKEVEAWGLKLKLPRLPSEAPLSYMQRLHSQTGKDILLQIKSTYEKNAYALSQELPASDLKALTHELNSQKV